MMNVIAAGAVEAAFIALVLWAMASDLRELRIPNAVSIALAALFVAYAAVALPASAWLDHLAAFAIVFAVGLALFYVAAFGGGDVKFLAAAALWVDLGRLAPFVLVVALLGGILALLLLGARLCVGRGGGQRFPPWLRPGAPMPYGVAIGGGALVVRYVHEIARFII